MDTIRLIVLDLDGTLTQHKTKLEAPNRAVLDRLAERYKLLMAGAGQCLRIWNQMERYPIDIIGNYGMQYAVYRENTGRLELLRDETIPCVRTEIEKRATGLRAIRIDEFSRRISGIPPLRLYHLSPSGDRGLPRRKACL